MDGTKRRNGILEENQCNQKYSPRCVHRAAKWKRKFYRGRNCCTNNLIMGLRGKWTILLNVMRIVRMKIKYRILTVFPHLLPQFILTPTMLCREFLFYIIYMFLYVKKKYKIKWMFFVHSMWIKVNVFYCRNERIYLMISQHLLALLIFPTVSRHIWLINIYNGIYSFYSQQISWNSVEWYNLNRYMKLSAVSQLYTHI